MSNIIPNYNNSYAPISAPIMDTSSLNNNAATQHSSSPFLILLYIMCCLSIIFCIYSMFSKDSIASLLCCIFSTLAISSFVSISITTISKA